MASNENILKMADEQKKMIKVDDLPPVTLPLTGNENIPVFQAGVAKRMHPGDYPAVVDGFVKIDGSTPFGGDQSMGGYRLTELGEPVEDDDGIRKIDLNNKTVWKTIEW